MSLNSTGIEWVKNPDGTPGYTWNPITGCLNHTDGLCKGGGFPCYAYKLANGRLKERYLANKTLPFAYTGTLKQLVAEDDPFYPRFWEDRLDDVIRGYHRADYPNGPVPDAAKPRGIFVCDMSDLFGIGIPEEWTKKVLRTINDWDNRFDRFYLLTKQPQNLIKFSPFPDNCWVGVTITESNTDAGSYLMDVKARVKFISFEPLLRWANYNIEGTAKALKICGVNWVIIGAQTKPYKPPKIEWVQEIALATIKAHIPLFIKDNLRPLLPNRMPFWCPVSWTEIDKGASIRMTENRLRQEIPE